MLTARDGSSTDHEWRIFATSEDGTNAFDKDCEMIQSTSSESPNSIMNDAELCCSHDISDTPRCEQALERKCTLLSQHSVGKDSTAKTQKQVTWSRNADRIKSVAGTVGCPI